MLTLQIVASTFRSAHLKLQFEKHNQLSSTIYYFFKIRLKSLRQRGDRVSQPAELNEKQVLLKWEDDKSKLIIWDISLITCLWWLCLDITSNSLLKLFWNLKHIRLLGLMMSYSPAKPSFPTSKSWYRKPRVSFGETYSVIWMNYGNHFLWKFLET